MRIGAQTLVVVADGQRSVFFRNSGGVGGVTLEPLHSMAMHNAANHEISTARAGQSRVAVNNQRSSFEQVDWHQVNENEFLKGASRTIEDLIDQHDFHEVVLVAAPTALGALRSEMSPKVSAIVKTQIAKDYTKTPIKQLEALLQKL